jgi:photosystem II stability/assembly factor-like uncharacterized protein
MKNILTILITLLVCNVFCQSDEWKQLPSPDKTFMIDLYLTGKGSLFGLDYFSQKFQYKHKLENKWEDISVISLFKGGLKEDRDGNLYFSNDIFMYKYDEDSLKASKVFNLTGAYPYFNNFIVLDNGDFLLNSGSNLLRYSKQGSLKNAKRFSLNYSFKKDGDAIFIHTGSSPDVLLRIDTLFNVLDSVEFLNPLLLISNNRLFGTEGYSDDNGRTWQKHRINNPFDYVYNISKGHDGTIFLSTYNQIYFSIDNGESYKAIQVFGPNGSISNGIKYISSSQNHEIVALVNRDGCAGTIYWSPDFGKTWEIIPLKDDSFISRSVLANNEEEYYVRNLCNYRSLNVATSKWEDFSFKVDGLDVFPTDLEYDEDGYLFAKGASKSYVKAPNQSEWLVTKSSIWQYDGSLHKYKNIIYSIGSFPQKIYFSEDHGITWQDLPIANIFGTDLFFTNAKKAFAINGTNNVKYFDLEKNESGILKTFDNFRIYNIGTTYSNNDLYIMGNETINSDANNKLYYTRDNGISWKEIPLNKEIYNTRFLSDYNNNIFIYTDKSVLYLEHSVDTLIDISPKLSLLSKINDLQIGLDGNIYLATNGGGVLKYEGKLGTGVKELNDETLSVYPNPTTDRITIKHTKPKQLISIYDAMGHLIFAKECLGIEEIVEVHGWKPGLYYVISNGLSVIFSKL